MFGLRIKASSFGLAFAGTSVLALGACCQAPVRTGTAEYSDISHLAYFDDKVGASDQSPVAIAILGPIAIQLGLDLAEWFIRGQADKYAATYTDREHIVIRNVQPPGSPPFGKHGTMSKGGVFLFARIVKVSNASDEAILALPRLNESTINSIAESIAEGESSLDSDDVVEYFGAMKAGEEHVLGLCLVGQIRPRTSADAFEFRVLGYTYPLLKSRATSTGVRSFDKVDSQFILKLDGPTTGFADEVPFSVSHAFPIKWNQGGASDYSFEWDTAIRSNPILPPRHKDFVLSATVVESSGFKSVLEKAADEIAKIDPDGLLGD